MLLFLNIIGLYNEIIINLFSDKEFSEIIDKSSLMLCLRVINFSDGISNLKLSL